MGLVPNPAPRLADDQELAVARMEVIAWLRDGAISNDPMFLLGHPDSVLAEKNEEIADRFISVVARSGFNLKVSELEEAAAFDASWTHREADFVGFKCPPPAATPADAKLLACAALLRNEWCRARLGGG